MSPSSERSPPSRGETKGEATKSRIVLRALELAASAGLGGISIGDLAQDLGLSKSGLFAHFGSKEQLQLDMLDMAADMFRSAVFDPAQRASRGEAKVTALFENVLGWIHSREAPGGCVFLAAAFEWDDAQGPVRQRLVEWAERFNAALARAAAAAIEQGEFRKDLDAELFAYELHGILMKFHFEARLLRSKKASAFARRAFARLLAAARP